MPEEGLLLVVFHSSSFVVVYLVTRSTRNLPLYSAKITSVTKGLSMSVEFLCALVFGQRLLKWLVGYTPINIIVVQKHLCIGVPACEQFPLIRRPAIWLLLGKCTNLLTDI